MPFLLFLLINAVLAVALTYQPTPRDYQDVKIQTNGIAGQGWELVSSGSGLSRKLCPRPLGAKVVTIRLPDGKMERFDVGTNPDCKLATDIPNDPDFYPAFLPRAGTSSTLVNSGGPLRVSGNVLLDMGAGEAYNPVNFQLTTENKFVYSLGKGFGIRSVTDPDGNTLTFSAAGISHSAGKSVAFTRDAQGRITAITDPAGRTTSWTYDAAGNRRTQILPNGVTTTWGYDSRNRLTSIEHKKADSSLIASYAYTLSGTGQRTKVLETTPAATRTVDYAYDALYRLTGETVTVGGVASTTTYQYDATGNRTRATVNGVQANYYYDQNDRMYYEGNNAVAFDANGNMLGLPSKGATYTYDAEDRLLRATHTSGATVDYAYDGEGARIESKVTQGATTATTRHLVDKNRAYAEVIEERDEAGSLLALYTHGHDLEGPVSQERFVGGTSTVSYFLTDALGSTRFLVDASGNVTDGYLYEPYGTVTQRTGTTANPYQFTGEQFDQATGMTYLRARWLANGIARFVKVDPHPGAMTRPLTLNDYVYANGNPLSFSDPGGRLALAPVVGAINIFLVAHSAFSFLSDPSDPLAAASAHPTVFAALFILQGAALAAELAGEIDATTKTFSHLTGHQGHHVIPKHMCGADREQGTVPLPTPLHTRLHVMLDKYADGLEKAGSLIHKRFVKSRSQGKFSLQAMGKNALGRAGITAALAGFYTLFDYWGEGVSPALAPGPNRVHSSIASAFNVESTRFIGGVTSCR